MDLPKILITTETRPKTPDVRKKAKTSKTILLEESSDHVNPLQQGTFPSPFAFSTPGLSSISNGVIEA